MAVPTGSRYGIVVVDLDRKAEGADGVAWWEAREGGEPLDTFTVRTPSGGLHLYFQCLPGDPEPTSAGKIAPGVDTRGEGGFVFGPGTVYKDPSKGEYRVENDSRPMPMPGWVRELLVGVSAGGSSGPVEAPPAKGLEKSMEDLEATLNGHSGEYADAWRLVTKGVRFIRAAGSPHGPERGPVDQFLTGMTMWLAGRDDWADVRGETVVALMGASLSHLEIDDREAGNTPYDRAVIASKFDRGAAKVRAERAADNALRNALARAKEEARTADLPPLLQHATGYYVLDEREDRGGYTRRQPLAAVKPLARQCWGDRREIRVPTKTGDRPMRAEEICDAYVTAVTTVQIDFGIKGPVIDRTQLSARLPLPRATPPEAKRDPMVAEWLDLLGGDVLVNWLAYAQHLDRTAPALVIVGGSHIGKTLLAESLACAMGIEGTGKLSKAVQKHNADLAEHPILFGDEGIPRDPQSKVPMTQELRELITAMVHSVEPKGGEIVRVRGAVRVILAANDLDSLFPSRTALKSTHDIAALARRFILIEHEDPETIRRLIQLATGLGSAEGSRDRLLRVAGHIRWLQENAPATEPQANAGRLAMKLRTGPASEALEWIEDAKGGQYVAVDEASGVLWYVSKFCTTGGSRPRSLTSKLGPYKIGKPKKSRTHPVTGESLPAEQQKWRWGRLDLAMLRADGIDV